MNYVEYLKKYQDIAYKVFYNSLLNDRLFHAYLLCGEDGTPLEQISKFLSACIISKGKKPFEIEDSNVEKRIFNDTFGDFVYLDAKNSSVKIDDIRNLEDKFARTSEEIYGKKIYVINGVENLSNDASNALLKFLEEPAEDTYAFLLTENEFKLLPTIKSRTQIIHFFNIDQNYLVEEAVSLGAIREDAEILSFFYNNEELIKEKSLEKDVMNLINLSVNTFKFANSKNNLLDLLFNEIIKNVSNKIALRFYFDYLLTFYKEALKFKNNQDIILKSYVMILKEISKQENLESSILTLMDARNEVSFNPNPSLLLFHTIRSVFGV